MNANRGVSRLDPTAHFESAIGRSTHLADSGLLPAPWKRAHLNPRDVMPLTSESFSGPRQERYSPTQGLGQGARRGRPRGARDAGMGWQRCAGRSGLFAGRRASLSPGLPPGSVTSAFRAYTPATRALAMSQAQAAARPRWRREGRYPWAFHGRARLEARSTKRRACWSARRRAETGREALGAGCRAD